MLFRKDLSAHIFIFTCPFYHFLWLAACGGFIDGIILCLIIVRWILVFFLLFFASYFFDFAFSGRYLYDSSDYHSSYLLILITHLPFLWEMRCSHHDSTRSRNHENVRREINSGFTSHSFLHRHTLLTYRAAVHTHHFSTCKFLIFLSTIVIPRQYVYSGDAQPHTYRRWWRRVSFGHPGRLQSLWVRANEMEIRMFFLMIETENLNTPNVVAYSSSLWIFGK